MGESTSNLATILQAHHGEKHAVAIRGYPDPDSIGSAMAHAYISEEFDIECIILYFDDISHQENRALVKRLAIEMVRYDEKLDLTGLDAIAIVDSQLFQLPPPLDKLPIISVVDHHKNQMDTTAEFVDIREDSGATCSIYAEYLSDKIATMDRENPFCAKLASALLYGIRSDTDNYLRAREIDYRAASFLAPSADHDLLMSISLQSISPRTMEITQRAFANKVIVDNFLVSGSGYVREEDRDSIGQAADYLIQREGIDTVLCYGIVNNRCIDGSLRTLSDVVDPDRFIKELLGKGPDGVFYGGGRTDKGAFRIALGLLSQCPDRDLLWSLVRKTVEELFIKKIGTKPEEA
ncbi:MAG: DHH family phosphoesterase [Myxococcota bacterium]|nr:DHH family phosphoesterase [Myxococcota bacterium]